MRLARQEPGSDELDRHRSEPEGAPARLRALYDMARGELFGTPWLDEGSRRRAVESVTPRTCGCPIGIDPASYRGGERLVPAVDEVVPAGLAVDGAELTEMCV
ncbi:hypothetical protein [Streptomyces sp. MN13]